MEIPKQKIYENPIALFTVLFDKPFEYQQKFLLSNSNRIVFRSGRQIGKTTVCAIKAISHALTKEKRVVILLSPTQRQSSLMFRKIRAYLKHSITFSEIESESQTMIRFKNDSEIHSLPGNNPDTIRGFSPTLLIIDEAAFVKDDVYTSAEPSLAATNGQMILISTPFGKRGRFYQAFQEDGFEKYHIKSGDCPNITQEFLDGQKISRSDMEYSQEFEGEFMEEADSYFNRNLVLSCIGEKVERNEQEHLKEYYLGVDIARYGLDETVYTVVEVDRNLNILVIDIQSTSKKPLTDVIGRVTELNKKWGFRAVYMDETGIGAGAVDGLKERGIPLKNLKNETAGVVFTMENKEEMYKNLKLNMEQGKIKFWKHDKLINQLCDLQYEFTESGGTKIHHPDAPNAHDDYPDSLILAIAGVRKNKYKPYIA